MEKWKKVLLIILLILAMLGALMGFVMSKSGIGQMLVLANIDLFGLIELILLIVAVTCTILDIYETYENKNEFDSLKFKVMISSKNKLRNILIFLVILNIFEFGAFFSSSEYDMHMLPLCFITLMLTSIFAFHNRAINGIGENGLLYWGIYHSWENVKSHNFGNDTLLEVNLTNKFLGFEYNHIIKLDFDKKDKTDLESFLEKMPKASINTTNTEKIFNDNQNVNIELQNPELLQTTTQAADLLIDVYSCDQPPMSNNVYEPTSQAIEQLEQALNSIDLNNESPCSKETFNQISNSNNQSDLLSKEIEEYNQLLNNIDQYSKLISNIEQCTELSYLVKHLEESSASSKTDDKLSKII